MAWRGEASEAYTALDACAGESLWTADQGRGAREGDKMMWSPEDVRLEALRIRTAVTDSAQPLNYSLVDVTALLTHAAELMAGSADLTQVQQLEARVAELERQNAALREVVTAAAQDGSVSSMASVVERARALLRAESAPATAQAAS